MIAKRTTFNVTLTPGDPFKNGYPGMNRFPLDRIDKNRGGFAVFSDEDRLSVFAHILDYPRCVAFHCCEKLGFHK